MYRLIALLLYAIVMVVYSAIDGPRRTRDRNRTLKWVARRLGGTHAPAHRDYNPAVAWNLEGVSAVLYIRENANGRAEGVTFRIRRSCSFRLRLQPETGWARVRRFFGAQDLQAGDPAFDRVFLVQSDRELKARALLTRDVREAMSGLAKYGPVFLDLGPNGIVLRTPEGFVDQLDRLTAFAGEAMTLGRALLHALDPSVVISEVESSGPGLCPVCSTPVEDDRGQCARCRTPHHKDCWNYLGGCAIFACAGRPRKLRSLPGRGPARADLR